MLAAQAIAIPATPVLATGSNWRRAAPGVSSIWVQNRVSRGKDADEAREVQHPQ